MKITSAHTELISKLRSYLVPWRKMTIAFDGLDNSGKSTLARFLAWQLGMPAIETDLCFTEEGQGPTLDLRIFRRLVEQRHRRNRPVIVEGIFILRTLDELDVAPDFLIRVESPGRDGGITWASQFEAYADKYLRLSTPDFLFTWVEPYEPSNFEQPPLTATSRRSIT